MLCRYCTWCVSVCTHQFCVIDGTRLKHLLGSASLNNAHASLVRLAICSCVCFSLPLHRNLYELLVAMDPLPRGEPTSSSFLRTALNPDRALVRMSHQEITTSVNSSSSSSSSSCDSPVSPWRSPCHLVTLSRIGNGKGFGYRSVDHMAPSIRA
jgi:hypothetical protein